MIKICFVLVFFFQQFNNHCDEMKQPVRFYSEKYIKSGSEHSLRNGIHFDLTIVSCVYCWMFPATLCGLGCSGNQYMALPDLPMVVSKKNLQLLVNGPRAVMFKRRIYIFTDIQHSKSLHGTANSLGYSWCSLKLKSI